MAMGAFQAIQSAGKSNQIKVFGFDGADEVVQKVSEQKIVATGMQYPKVMAKTAAAFAVEFFKGRKSFPQHIPVAVTLVNAQNANQFTSEK
jgi:ribose transport system substrate-binding protein